MAVLWSRSDDMRLRKRYPHEATAGIAKALGRSLAATYERAAKLGVKKSASYLASPAACRLRRGDNAGWAHRFSKGHVPANKGLRRPGWGPGRMRETQFKKGQMSGAAQRNYVPIGTERFSKDGYLERKYTDDHPVPARRWIGVHLLVWQEHRGPVPKGCAIVFRNGNKKDIRIENLECITRRALMLRNSVHNLPKPIAELVQLRGALNRKINARTRHEEQDGRSAQSPVR